MPNPFDLERQALGEKPIDADANTLAKIARSNEEILRAYPPERMAKQIRARMQHKPRRWMPVVQLATAAVLLLTAGTLLLQQQPEERTKGLSPQLHVWRKTAADPQALAEGAVVKAGDVLQVGYVTAGSRYGVIASLDGRGNVTLHLPAKESAEPRLSKHAGTIVLETAYELDDAPGFERFFLVTSDERIETAAVLQALKSLSAERDGGRISTPQLHGKVHVVSLRVDKGQP
jgi:hypothetical protein